MGPRAAALGLALAGLLGCDGGDAASPRDSAVSDAAPADAVVAPDGVAPDSAAPHDLGVDRGVDLGPDPLACNGARHLCDRPLPQVTFLLGHNAHAVRPPFSRFAANQGLPIAEQLAAGARGVGIKLYWTDHEACGPLGLYGYHGVERLGCVPFADIAAPVVAFMRANPREVLVMTVEGSAPAERVVAGLQDSGLAAWTFTGPAEGDWPTLGALIEADQRLLVLRAGGGAGLPDLWQVVRDTPYDFESTAEMGCEPHRGPATAPLFQINHFLTRLRPVPEEAAATNGWAALGARVAACAEARGWPTILLMDFLGEGDAFEVVAALNGP
ncbi:MAG: hypothetical protein KC613_27110, partial [Myxococcales bacterium]|nr:hypothetical protein [Myxococcales bacterium]